VSTGCTGGAPIFTVAVNAGITDGPRTETGLSERTRLEMAAGRRAADRRAAQTVIPSVKKSSVIGNATPFSLGEPVDTGLLEAATNRPADLAKDIQHEVPVLDFPPVQERVNAEAPTSLPKFDRAAALEFYNAVGQTAFMLGVSQGKYVVSAEEFQELCRIAIDRREHLFFHIATLKPEWADPKKHVKGFVTTANKEHVLECRYLWGDCDAAKYQGDDPAEAKLHYESEGIRISKRVDEGLAVLRVEPFAKWRSGAGWQFLIKLDQAISGDEADMLDAKLHIALGFDTVVRNCNRYLRVPGSINWKDGKDGRVPSLAGPLQLSAAIADIEHVRKVLADIDEPKKEANASGATEITVDWSKVKRPSWLQSVADLPDDIPSKLKRIIGHTGNLKDLNDDLIELGMLTKGYGSWSDVTHAIAAAFKFYGKCTMEQIAGALLADLPCNQHIAKQRDKERAIERAITRSHKPNEPKVEGDWPGGFNEETGKPRDDILNTVEAIRRAGIECSYDLFRCKEFWNGHVDKKFDGEISDAAVTLTRVAIRQQFKFYPEKVEMQEAITSACHNNKHDPVLDYFVSLKWDGTPRLAKMLANYLGAPDTPLNEAFSVKVLCAIVRRAKSPGCKYDQELVLQGAQSIRKSTFCEDLAVAPDLYTDAGDLGAAIKDQIDVTKGKQIIE
jgi:hypothetical protein